jgi:YesN/AraC family two-component response regulator
MPGANQPKLRKLLPPNAPKFLIIGAQKAGTTALYEYLSQHPQLAGSVPKELHYFSCDNRFSKGDDFYHAFFPPTKNDAKITFDTSPSYLRSNVAYKRIYDYNPEIKLIVLFRNPVERSYSAWNMYRERYKRNRNWFYEQWVAYCCNQDIQFKKRDEISLLDFKAFVADEMKHLIDNPGSMLEAPILTQGFYSMHLSNYLSLFKKDQILIIENTELREKTVSTLHRIEDFLGVDSHFWKIANLSPVFEGVFEEKMDEEVRAMLSTFYATHNANLFSLIGQKYDWNDDWVAK